MEKDGYYYYCLGEDELDKGKPKDAIAFFKKSLAKEKHFKTHHKLSILYKKNSLYDEAEYHLEKAHSLNTNNDKVAIEYAQMLCAKNRVDDAKKIITSILNRNKTYGPAMRLQKELSELKNLKN
jgi:Tfp pilus assembly protein PilF